MLMLLEWIFRFSNSSCAIGRSIIQFDDEDDDDAVGGTMIANLVVHKCVEMQSRLYNWDVVESGCNFFFFVVYNVYSSSYRHIDRLRDPLWRIQAVESDNVMYICRSCRLLSTDRFCVIPRMNKIKYIYSICIYVFSSSLYFVLSVKSLINLKSLFFSNKNIEILIVFV